MRRQLALAVLRVMTSVDILAQANLAHWESGAGTSAPPTPWSVQEHTSLEERVIGTWIATEDHFRKTVRRRSSRISSPQTRRRRPSSAPAACSGGLASDDFRLGSGVPVPSAPPAPRLVQERPSLATEGDVRRTSRRRCSSMSSPQARRRPSSSASTAWSGGLARDGCREHRHRPHRG